MFVDTRHDCGTCVHNGFLVDDEILEKIGVDEEPIFYDEWLRIEASDALGIDIKRTEAEDDGQCEMGHNWDAGCSLYTCSECGKVVGHIPFVDGC
jgi:hypothetical protein